MMFEQDHVVSASYDKIIRLWDIETCKQVRTFSGHSQSILAVAFDPTGNVIASGCELFNPNVQTVKAEDKQIEG